MRRSVTFYYRKKNPSFFSIELVFQPIAARLASHYDSEFQVAQHSMPRSTKLKNLVPNIVFARRLQGDINHITGDVHYIMMGFSRRKINILTIHDCVLLNRLSPRDPRFWIIKWFWYQLPVRKADRVTVISENTKTDLLRFVKCDPSKIRVISNYIDPLFRDAFRERRSISGVPKILFIGTTVNKNLPRLAEALEGIPAELDIIGSLSIDQRQKLEEHGISYTASFNLSRDQVLEHYASCDLLAFPSLFEGFGLPVIEGQACGLPVLTSDLSPMREVAGEGACLVDPCRPESIREGLLRIINDDSYRQRLIRAGLENVKRFDLDSVVSQYAKLYRELQDERGWKRTKQPARV